MPVATSLATILERDIRRDGTTKLSTIRKISEDLSRKRLIGLDVNDIFAEMEDTFNNDFRYFSGERRYSNASFASSSYDALWDNARRLSEAGVRRTSDTSIVLTEDTDSFIIGDHVWVGGTKPGQIAYIGETKFAPGEWAGVVLDEPVGKNDGSVAGIRYFQCEAKKGVFSRLTRLTRTQLEYGGGGDSVFSAPEPCSGISTPSRRLVSPSGSTRDLMKKSFPSMSSIVSSASHAPSHASGEIKLGDRVIVMSSHGSKAGVLRYMGPTEFAAGEWCGVELDDPLGKNDGSVGDKRYFECGPKFGLFAPVHKVSRSPSNRKPSTAANCAVHRASVTSATPMRRAGSRESVTSAASTASVRSSRDVLKEKELHIERLLKERDLERAEITRAASQADDAEHKLSTLSLEFDQFRDENEAKLFDIQSHLNRVQQEKVSLCEQLDDEKRKVEDLQFRIEEETIMKGDIEAASVAHLDAIRELEQQLSAERQRTETLEQESTKLFETEETLSQCRVELETARIELSDALGRLQHNSEQLEKGGEASSIEIARLRKELDEAQAAMKAQVLAAETAVQKHAAETEKVQKQTDEVVFVLKAQLEDLKQQHATEQEALSKSLSELRNSQEVCRNETERAAKEKLVEIDTLRLRLQEAEKLLAATSEDLDKGTKAKHEVETLLQKELQDLQAAVKLKSSELEKEAERIVKLNEEIQSCKSETVSLQSALKEKIEECDTLVSTTKELQNAGSKLEESDNQRRLKIEELVRVSGEQVNEIQAKAASIDSLQNQIIDKDNQLKMKLEELSNIQKEKESSLVDKSTAIETLEKQIADKEAHFKIKTEELLKINDEQVHVIQENTLKIDSLEAQIKEVETTMKLKTDELSKLNNEQLSVIEERKITVEGLERAATSKDKQIDELRLEIAALRERLEAEAVVERQHHEKEIDACKTQLREVETRLSEREAELRQLRNEMEKQSEVLQTRDVAIKRQLDEALAMSQKLASSEESSNALSTEIHQLQLEVGDLQRRLQAADEKCSQLSQQKQKLEDDISGLMGTSSDSSAQLTKMNAELRVREQEVDRAKEAVVVAQQETEMVKHKLLLMTQHVEKTEEDLAEKVAQLMKGKEEAEREAAVAADKAKETETHLKLALEELTVQVQRDALENKQQLEQLRKEADKVQAELLKAVEQGKEAESVLIKRLEAVTEEACRVEEGLKKQLETCASKIKQTEEELKLKSDLVVGTEQELKEKLQQLLKQSQEAEKTMRSQHAEELGALAKDKVAVEAELSDAKKKITLGSEEHAKQQLQLEEAKRMLSEKDLANVAAAETITRLEHEKSEAGKVIGDREEKLGAVNAELKSLREEKEATEKILLQENGKLSAATQELERLRNAVETTELTASERDVRLNSAMNELQMLKQEKDSLEALLLEKSSNLESFGGEFDKLKTEKVTVENLALERETKSVQLAEEIRLTRDSFEKLQEEKLSTESSLKDVELKLNGTVEELGNVIKEKDVIAAQVTDKEATVNELTQEIEKLKQNFNRQLQDKAGVESTLSDKDSKLNNVTEELQKVCKEKDSLEKQSMEHEAALTQAVLEVKSLKENLDQKQAELDRSIAEVKKESLAAGGIKDKLDFEKRTSSELQEKFNQTERERLQLLADVQRLTEAAQNTTEMNVQIEALQKELQNTQQREQEFKTNSELEKSSIEKMLESTKSLLAQKENDFQKQKAEISSLSVETVEAKKYKSQLDLLQREKKQLEHKVVEMQIVQTKATLNNSVAPGSQLSEDKDGSQGQVDFLNSVIVDLHRKNDDLKARIEILEMGITAEDADELNLNGIKARMIAPRLFCDICDMFDLHDTEDCPRQAMDSPPPTQSAHKPARGPPVERSYCDICEIFGHTTEDCDDGETF